MPHDSNVRSFEREAFRKRLEKLAAQHDVADADFADCIYTAVTVHGIPIDDFRDTFGLSREAVDRWMTMKNMPQPTVRPKVLGWVLGQLGAEQ